VSIITVLELTSIPTGIYKGIDIIGKLKSIQTAYAGVCGTLLSKTAIAVLANSGGKIPLPPTPVQGAKVQFSYLPSLSPLATRTTTTLTTDSNGIVTSPCFSTLQHISYSVQHDNVDFGRGKGAWSSDPMEQRWLNKDIPFAVMGVADIQCPTGTSLMSAEGFNSLGSIPEIDAGTLTANFAGYGTVPIAGVPFDVYIMTVKIGSGTTTNTGGLTWKSPKPLIDLPIKELLGTFVVIKAEVKFGACVIHSARSLTLPALCTPPQVYNPATGKCETPIPVCTPPQIYNPATGKCETPTVPCIEWETNAAVSIPSVLKMPYDISISNANWKCKATGAKTPVSTTAEAYIGGHKFYIPISGGAGSLSLSQADIDKIIGAPITPPVTPPVIPPITPPVTPPVVPTECVKSGKLGVPGTFLVSLAELQAFLNKCFPGATAEPGTGTWTGAYKITRSTGGKYPAGTYFWTTRWEDIKGTY